jgi:alkylated DNA nucleotide flippase Atl1
MSRSGETASSSGPDWSEIKEPSPDFVEQVLATVRTIPTGRVMTYGDVAAVNSSHADLAGAPGSYGARLVGNVMSRFGSDVPWWRVIRSTGHPPRFHEKQALPFYVEERTPLTGPEDNYRIDLKLARFDPDKPEEPTQVTMFGV